MKTILCYGDSNTWGHIPGTGARFPRGSRWPGVLQAALGDSFHVIEEGLNGRTTVWDDPIEEHKNGKTYLKPCLETHKPLDLVILMLGTNDLKKRFSLTAYDVAAGAGRLVHVIQTSQTGPDDGAPKVLLVAPPPIGDLKDDFVYMFEGALAKAKDFPTRYWQVSVEHNCAFFDAATIIAPSPLDGLHLDEQGQRLLGENLAPLVRELLDAHPAS